jgi:hypothetical protein
MSIDEENSTADRLPVKPAPTDTRRLTRPQISGR